MFIKKNKKQLTELAKYRTAQQKLAEMSLPRQNEVYRIHQAVVPSVMFPASRKGEAVGAPRIAQGPAILPQFTLDVQLLLALRIHFV